MRARYAEAHPDWVIVEARLDSEPWRKGRAVNPAIEASDAEVIVMADSDVWTDGLEVAVAAIEAGAGWAIPHEYLHRLSESGTEAVLADEDWRDQPLAQRAYRGVEGGGVVVARRETLCHCPLDERIAGWGQDDECHAFALRALAGEPWRGDADLFHLWHPPQERMTRRRGSQENWELRRRYFVARSDPDAMRALLEESRVDSEPDQPALHDRAPVAG